MQNSIQNAIAIFNKNKVHNITIAFAFLVAIASYLVLIRTESQAHSEVLVEQAKQESSKSISHSKEEIAIDISGAVKKPGVYSLPIGSRLIDGLKLADGLTDSADTTYFYQSFNRASVLTDQQKIYIPSVGESLTLESRETGEEGSSLINVNTGSEGELDTLPGFGPITVKKIIDNRPYTAIQDLLDKKVVSDSILEKIKDRITL